MRVDIWHIALTKVIMLPVGIFIQFLWLMLKLDAGSLNVPEVVRRVGRKSAS
jgi:hypothetical protein